MFTVRKAHINDAGLIQQLASQVWKHTYGNILSPQQLDYMFEMMYSIPSLHQQMGPDKHQYFIAYNDNKPCGYISIEQENKQLFHLQKIYVLPDAQGSGAGRFLMETAFNYIKSLCPHPPCTIELNVNRSNKAKQFYEHMGYKVVRSGDFPIGNGYYMNDYIMSITI